MRNRVVCLFLSLTALTLGAGCTATETVTPPPPPPPVEDTCSAATPVCDPGCGSNEACVFADDACACQAVCNASAPRCGDGANAGCAAGSFCDVTCTCQPEITCLPDAPSCDGDGPNQGCDSGFVCNSACACEVEVVRPENVLARPSRSTPVDISTDDGVIAMVNTDHGTVSFFNGTSGQESRISRIATSDRSAASEPVSVVIHPDRVRAFVANRATGTISRITGIDTTTPTKDGELELGAEPMGLALSPTGATLWVTDWIAGTVTVVDTATFRALRTIDVGGNPYAIAITNDGDDRDDDEKALVTQFYARKRAGAAQHEATDDGREGVVHVIDLGASTAREVTLASLAECFRAPVGGTEVVSGCFPNQLLGITVHSSYGRTYAYVTSVAASPAGPVNFNHNMQALVSVIDVQTEAELAALTQNLNALIKNQPDNDGDDNTGRRFMNVPNGIDFVNRNDVAIGYVSSGGSDIVLRLEYSENGDLSVGSPVSFNIPVGQSPQGLVVRHGTVGAGAYVANLITRDLSVVSFRDQAQTARVESSPVPTDPRSDAFRQWRGKRFFNTSTAIWSKEGWGSCQGCHPMGLTDNITWSFAAGPRQTISLDGQFTSGDPSDMRALNWTAIFDETADFELNTRGVSGGSGAIRNTAGPIASASGTPFGAITVEDGSTENHQAMNGSLSHIIRTAAVCSNENTCPDWDLIDAYIQSVRSPRGIPASTSLESQGRLLFEDAGCNKCHAGAKWTVSRTFYDVASFTGELPNRVFAANRAFVTPMDPSQLVGLPRDVNVDTTLVAGDDSEGGTPAFKRMACNLRVVGTFGAGEGAAEVRANGQAAQGRNGFNPPSLLGLAAGAPYLHHGAAADLEALFAARFDGHTRAGNPNFIPSAEDREALIAFLLSIDEGTPPFDVVTGTVLCPTDF